MSASEFTKNAFMITSSFTMFSEANNVQNNNTLYSHKRGDDDDKITAKEKNFKFSGLSCL